MENDFDVVIIGAGISGLFAGNFLAKKGVKTLICEQHITPGGYVSGFKRNGFYFDAGTQSVCSCGMLFPLLRELNLFDKIKFNRSFFRFVTPGSDAILKSFDDLQAVFGKEFPGSSLEWKAFVDQLKEVAESVKLFMGEPSFMFMSGREKTSYILSLMKDKINRERLKSLGKYTKIRYPEFVSKHLKDPSMVSMFSNNCYKNASLSSYAFMWDCYFNYCWYPETGMQEFSNLLAENFIKNGGSIQYQTLIEKIIVEKGKACGITTSKGKTYNSDYVISAGDYHKLFQEILGGHYTKGGLRKEFVESKSNQSLFTMFLGLKTSAEKINKILKADHVYLTPDYKIDLSPDDLSSDDPDYFNKTGLEISSPTWHNPGLNKDGKASLVLQTFAPYSWMNKWGTGDNPAGKDEYRRLKNVAGEGMLSVVEKFIPGIRDEIQVMETASPITMERYTMNSWGSSIGWTWDPKLMPKIKNPSIHTPVKNLFTIGHWTMIPTGVSGAAASGKLVSNLIK